MEFKLLMEYNPESPSGLSWIETKYSGEYGNILVHKIGDMVGTLNTTKPYWRFTRQNKAYSCHRVICHLFNMFDYYDYSLEVDHINGDSTCNLIENLRVVDRKTNAKNRRKCCNNSSGTTGVSYSTKRGGNDYWTAQWRDENGKVRQKSFSVKTYGFGGAKESAISYRDRMIIELKLNGANYTDRHGK